MQPVVWASAAEEGSNQFQTRSWVTRRAFRRAAAEQADVWVSSQASISLPTQTILYVTPPALGMFRAPAI